VTPPPLRIAGDTHVGRVRKGNEDALIVEPRLGLYAVLDGMGGANAGEVASGMARDAIREFVLARRGTLLPKELLGQAIKSGGTAVHNAAKANPEHHGMGTTVVACLVTDGRRAVIGHVGDSRAYLLREGRLQPLTRDHTVVEELVSRGQLSPDEVERHPYKNVLSRNLGSRSETRVSLLELEIQGGDLLLLCSDGLYGYAAVEAIQYVLGSGDAPDHVCRDLIELALRGGGGDNVSTVVLEAPAPAATSTQVVRTSGATAWWQKRQRFLAVAKERGLTKNPIVRGLDPEEALELVALSLCQAVFHDLEKSTGVNVWTFAQQLAGGWFEGGGDWAAVRGLIDILGMSARTVIDEVRATDPQLGFLLDLAVSRALVVAELALGGLLAERLHQVDTDLIELQTSLDDEVEDLPEESLSDTGERFVDRPTIPFLRPDRPVTSPGISSEVLDGIHKTLTIARARTSPRAELVKQVLGAIDTIASEGGASFATAVQCARELYGVRSIDDAGVMPLFDALDQARIITASSVHQLQTTEANRARVLRALSTAHQRLVGATTGLVLEAVAPFRERLREAQAATAELHDQVARAERRRVDLERKFATVVDPSLPWGARGDTEW
jgi:serine/threonine protein phosphatase PrpC